MYDRIYKYGNAVVFMKKGSGVLRKSVAGCECLDEAWAVQANGVCSALGDCGAYVNYQGVFTDDGYAWKVDEAKQEFSPNSVNIVSGGIVGRVIDALVG